MLIFKDFFNILKNRISGGLDTPVFFRDLMSMITDVPEEDWDGPKDPASNKIKDNSIRSYVKTGLSGKFAKKIVYKLKRDNFIASVKSHGDDVLEILAQDYRPYDNTADRDNIAEKLANEFVEIIKTAAGLIEPDKLYKQRAERAELEAREKYGDYLLNEANQCCPFPGCGKSLVEKTDGKVYEKYKVSLVDKQKAPECDNLIALCTDCYAIYLLDSNSKHTKELKNVKKLLSRKVSSEKLLDNKSVDKGILKVLTKIKKLKSSDIGNISYEPQMLSNKIPPEEDIFLFNNVRMLVTTYYLKVREI